jgi:redox-sensitive bicupin YhaK (pirin superfamily)
MSANVRPVTQSVLGVETQDGAGVRLKRVIGMRSLPDLDPFLLLDEFRSDQPDDYIAGFPDHPHRGFETVTYMLAGRMRHRDSRGHEGLLTAGSVQWMTAGRGIVHSEMPEQENGLLAGFQLWVNLPAAQKMCEPRYQEIPPEQIPDITRKDGVRVRIIAGDALGAVGPVDAEHVQATYLDVSLPEGTSFQQRLPREHSAFCYVFEGECDIGGGTIGSADLPKRARAGELAVLGAGDSVLVGTNASTARLLLVAGRPLREPIARAGPFVMNNAQELRRAVEDFQSGLF